MSDFETMLMNLLGEDSKCSFCKEPLVPANWRIKDGGLDELEIRAAFYCSQECSNHNGYLADFSAPMSLGDWKVVEKNAYFEEDVDDGLFC